MRLITCELIKEKSGFRIGKCIQYSSGISIPINAIYAIQIHA